AGMPSKPARQTVCELEAEIEPVRPDMEQQVARRRRRPMNRAGEPGKRMQPGRTRYAEEPVPDSGADSHDASQLPLRDPEAHRPLESAHVGEQVAHLLLGARLNDSR